MCKPHGTCRFHAGAPRRATTAYSPPASSWWVVVVLVLLISQFEFQMYQCLDVRGRPCCPPGKLLPGMHASPADLSACLPASALQVRHAESEGNVDNIACEFRFGQCTVLQWHDVACKNRHCSSHQGCGGAVSQPCNKECQVASSFGLTTSHSLLPADTYLPDPRVPLTARGWQQVCTSWGPAVCMDGSFLESWRCAFSAACLPSAAWLERF